MREWLYKRLPKGMAQALVDSMLDSFGEPEQQNALRVEQGETIVDNTRYYPYERDGQWMIGAGTVIGNVGELDEQQQNRLDRYRTNGMSREVAYAMLIQDAEDTQKAVRRQLRQNNLTDVPAGIRDDLTELMMYEQGNDIDPRVVQAMQNRDYTSVSELIAEVSRAPAEVIQQRGDHIVEVGDAPNTESLVTEIMRNSAANETGRADFSRMSQIIDDTGGTKSYGILGLNTGQNASMFQFLEKHGESLGLTATPGSAEFDAQWQGLAANNPQALINATADYTQSNIIEPAQRVISQSGGGKYKNDPRMVNMVSDMMVQYGPSLAQGNVAEGLAKGSKDVESIIRDIGATTVANVDKNFRSYLDQNPENRQGLINRLNNRVEQSLKLAAGPSTDRPLTAAPPSSAPITVQTPVTVAANQGNTNIPTSFFTDTETGLPFGAQEIEARFDTQVAGASGGGASGSAAGGGLFPGIGPGLAPSILPEGESGIGGVEIQPGIAAPPPEPIVPENVQDNATLGQLLGRGLQEVLTLPGRQLDNIQRGFDLGTQELANIGNAAGDAIGNAVGSVADTVGNATNDLTNTTRNNAGVQGFNELLRDFGAEIQSGMTGRDLQDVISQRDEQVVMNQSIPTGILPEAPVLAGDDPATVPEQIPQQPVFTGDDPAAIPDTRDEVQSRSLDDLINAFRNNFQRTDIFGAVQNQLAEDREDARRNALLTALGAVQSGAGGQQQINSARELLANQDLGSFQQIGSVTNPAGLSAGTARSLIDQVGEANRPTTALDQLRASREVLNELNAGNALTGNPALTLQDTLTADQATNAFFENRTFNQSLRDESLSALDAMRRESELRLQNDELTRRQGVLDQADEALQLQRNELLSPITPERITRLIRQNNQQRR